VTPKRAAHPFDRVDVCVTHLLWKRVSEVVMEVLDSVTLGDPAGEADTLSGEA
jgi:hypothetical protein